MSGLINETHSISTTESQFLVEFPEILQQLELPILPGTDCMELIRDDEPLMMTGDLFLEGPKDYKYCGYELPTPDCCLDNFPDDMFDYIDTMPSPSAP